MKIRQDLYSKITEIFLKRLSLFLHGDRDGVSLNSLIKNASGIFLSTENFIANSKFNYPNLYNDSDNSKIIYKKVLEEHRLITSERWNAELQLFCLLYILIRSTTPKIIIETGVANGISTNSILFALNENANSGVLHSFDILPETRNSNLIEGKWIFHLLGKKKTNKQFFRIIENLPKIDIWLRDSNHGYRWQKFEYLLAVSRLNKNGILISDDIDSSSAWIEVIPKYFKESYIIFDSRKFIGIAYN